MITRLASIAGALALMMTAPVLAQQGAAPAQPGAGAGAGAGQAAQAAPGLAGADQQTGAGDRGERGGRGRLAACRADVQAHCKGVEAGGGRKTACLQENLAKLSPVCGAIVQARAEGKEGKGGRQSMAACRVDAATFCQNAENGGGRMRCLRENQAKLSPECQAVLAERVQTMGNFRQACKADRETHCAGVERGGGKLMQCLRENQAKLSPACGEAITAMPERGGKGRGKRAEAAPQSR